MKVEYELGINGHPDNFLVQANGRKLFFMDVAVRDGFFFLDSSSKKKVLQMAIDELIRAKEAI